MITQNEGEIFLFFIVSGLDPCLVKRDVDNKKIERQRKKRRDK